MLFFGHVQWNESLYHKSQQLFARFLFTYYMKGEKETYLVLFLFVCAFSTAFTQVIYSIVFGQELKNNEKKYIVYIIKTRRKK